MQAESIHSFDRKINTCKDGQSKGRATRTDKRSKRTEVSQALQKERWASRGCRLNLRSASLYAKLILEEIIRKGLSVVITKDFVPYGQVPHLHAQ